MCAHLPTGGRIRTPSSLSSGASAAYQIRTEWLILQPASPWIPGTRAIATRLARGVLPAPGNGRWYCRTLKGTAQRKDHALSFGRL